MFIYVSTPEIRVKHPASVKRGTGSDTVLPCLQKYHVAFKLSLCYFVMHVHAHVNIL